MERMAFIFPDGACVHEVDLISFKEENMCNYTVN